MEREKSINVTKKRRQIREVRDKDSDSREVSTPFDLSSLDQVSLIISFLRCQVLNHKESQRRKLFDVQLHIYTFEILESR